MSPLKYNQGKYKWRVFAPPGYEGAEGRRPYYFESKEKAQAFCDSVKRWDAARKGKVRGIKIDDADINWLGFLKNELGTLSSLPDVIRHWKRTSAELAEKMSVVDLCDAFLTFQEAKNLKPTTIAEIRSKLRRFSLTYGPEPVHEVSPLEMQKYLLTLPAGWTRKGHFKWLRQMFSYAKDRKATAENPFDSFDAPPRVITEPGIYRPSDMERLLTTADDQFPELVPWLALLGFNFLRQCELVPAYAGDPVLQWSDFLLTQDPPQILVRADVAKQTRRESGNKRPIPIQDAASHWIMPELLFTRSGAVVPFATERKFQIEKRKLFAAAEVEGVTNGLRHSCISYYLAANRETGIALTAQWAGNSEQVSRSFYDARLMPEDGAKWFGIRRK